MPPTHSNLQRAKLRQRCREALAHHISSQTGIKVQPLDVRLLPSQEHGYMWKSLPEKTHLFKKQLSKLSAGTYLHLIREVGRSFEAVPLGDDAQPSENCDNTFTGQIQRLQNANAAWERRFRSLLEKFEQSQSQELRRGSLQKEQDRRMRKIRSRLERVTKERDHLREQLNVAEQRVLDLESRGSLAMDALQKLTTRI